MLRPEPREVKDFESLRGTAAHDYLLRAYAGCTELLVTQRDGEVFRTLQGQAQAYRNLLGMIDERFTTNGKRG